jgi:arginine exporter protein ArgO
VSLNLMAILEGLTLGSALIVAIGAQNAFLLRQ